jgi:PTH1 family peptidyl-tRNA hydrolase
VGHPGEKSEVIHWVLKKPSPDHRQAIEDGIVRSIKALPQLLAGDMEKAMVQIHTSKPQRPKPPRPTLAPAVSPQTPAPPAIGVEG